MVFAVDDDINAGSLSRVQISTPDLMPNFPITAAAVLPDNFDVHTKGRGVFD